MLATTIAAQRIPINSTEYRMVKASTNGPLRYSEPARVTVVPMRGTVSLAAEELLNSQMKNKI
jgi:hypothetical protein